MSTITSLAQKIADTIQSLDIKANYKLMLDLMSCIQGLNMIAQEAQKLEKENAELKKALGMNEDASEQKEIKMEEEVSD